MKPIHIFLAIALTGCGPLTPEQRANVSATGSFLTRKVAQIAFQTVINGMTASREKNIDWTQGLAEGLRTQQGNLLTGADVKELVDIWTPEKPEFKQLGTQLATVYAQAKPETPKEAAKVLEQISLGLDKATANK